MTFFAAKGLIKVPGRRQPDARVGLPGREKSSALRPTFGSPTVRLFRLAHVAGWLCYRGSAT